MSQLGYLIATGTEGGATVQDGIEVVLDSVSNITQLISTYPFNIYFGFGILGMGITLFAIVKRVF